MDRVVATAAVVVKTMENTNNRYVENIKWYPYYEHNGNDGQEQLPRILQAGSYGGSSSSSSSSSSGGSSYSSGGSDCSSSSSSSGSKNAPWVKPFSICMFLLFGVFPFLYRLGLCHGLCLGILYLFKCCIDFDDPDKEAGTPPQSEEAFFAMDIDDAAADDDIGTKERGGSYVNFFPIAIYLWLSIRHFCAFILFIILVDLPVICFLTSLSFLSMFADRFFLVCIMVFMNRVNSVELIQGCQYNRLNCFSKKSVPHPLRREMTTIMRILLWMVVVLLARVPIWWDLIPLVEKR